MDTNNISSIDVEKIIREYLPGVIHLSLATSQNDIPWVCELHFAYDENLNLYFRSLASRRHSGEIAQNSKVAGNIIKQHSLTDPAVGVYFEGEARLLESDEELAKAFKHIKERFQADDDILDDAKRDDGHKFYKIAIENWYIFGKFGMPNGQKHTLKWNKGKK